MEKRLLLILAIIIVGWLPTRAQGDTIKIVVSSQCEMCKKKIEEGLRFEKGVKLATLDLKTHTVTVIYNGKKTTPEKLRHAIAAMGYSADNVPPDSTAYEKLHECCKKPHLE